MSKVTKSDLISEIVTVSGMSEIGGNRLYYYPTSKLKDILHFAKKGHTLIMFVGRRTVSPSYFRLLHKLDDITKYPCLIQPYNYDSDITDELETIVNTNKDDFMYRVYAKDITPCIRKKLYSKLMNDVNLTHDFDYRTVSDKESISYLNAVSMGYNKAFAYHVLRYFKTAQQYAIIVDAINKGLDKKEIVDMVSTNKHHHNTISTYLSECLSKELNPSKYFKYLNIKNAVYSMNSEEFFTIVVYTKEAFVPNTKVDFPLYMQYLEWLGVEDAHLLYDEYDGSNAMNLEKSFVLLEIEHVLGIPTEKYLKHVNSLTQNALKCIALGESLETYLNLNLPMQLDKICTQLLTGKDTSKLHNILGLKLKHYIN